MTTQHLKQPRLAHVRVQRLQLCNHGRDVTLGAQAIGQHAAHRLPGALRRLATGPGKARERVKQIDSQRLGLSRQMLANQRLAAWKLAGQQRHDGARKMRREAARRRDDLDKLLSELADDPVGGLLAVPARDTLKRVDKHGRVVETVDRSLIWQAYTPQMFRLGALHRALADSLVADAIITDEASAMEWSGQAPRLIEGRSDNIKVTRPEDLEWLRLRWANRR